MHTERENVCDRQDARSFARTLLHLTRKPCASHGPRPNTISHTSLPRYRYQVLQLTRKFTGDVCDSCMRLLLEATRRATKCGMHLLAHK